MTKPCPNYNTCKMVNTDIIPLERARKEEYIREYCLKDEHWIHCKRYITKRALWFCPDWILPDSTLSEEEIIERAESEMNKSKI